MEINDFRGELTDISAKKEALGGRRGINAGGGSGCSIYTAGRGILRALDLSKDEWALAAQESVSYTAAGIAHAMAIIDTVHRLMLID